LSGPIQHIIPALDKPYQLARVVFDNRQKKLSPGLLVEGRIVVDEFVAKLAVVNDAVQTMNGQSGVFVKQGEAYAFTPLVLGRGDDQHVEVLSGLSLGQEYVSKNSYLLKADIEKSEAEHQH
jgi:cobalt-zinc-cadmium efflux system membrane fusion protein